MVRGPRVVGEVRKVGGRWSSGHFPGSETVSIDAMWRVFVSVDCNESDDLMGLESGSPPPQELANHLTRRPKEGMHLFFSPRPHLALPFSDTTI